MEWSEIFTPVNVFLGTSRGSLAARWLVLALCLAPPPPHFLFLPLSRCRALSPLSQPLLLPRALPMLQGELLYTW